SVALVGIPASIMVGIKRLHDRNKSGWWMLLFYGVPVMLDNIDRHVMESLVFTVPSFAITIWALVELGFLRGTPGPNRFGPDPLASASVGAVSS
ncbi:MAG: DUF805 domain-containing protein, partial [Pseudolabrys sp.]|nr:DUF805 domain-containing protein [Pseudolabrys sp.]